VNLALGRAGITLGFAAAILGAVTVGYGLIRHRPELVRLSRWYAGLVFLGGLLAAIAMERALITRDFTVLYVADNGSTKTPALYNFATLWGAPLGAYSRWLPHGGCGEVPQASCRSACWLGDFHDAYRLHFLFLDVGWTGQSV
jgi:cytochrome c biogenesis factor